MASTLLVFSDVTTGDPDNNGGVISKQSDGVGAVGDVPGHWDLPVRKFNIQGAADPNSLSFIMSLEDTSGMLSCVLTHTFTCSRWGRAWGGG